jgi:hypothetical protein
LIALVDLHTHQAQMRSVNREVIQRFQQESLDALMNFPAEIESYSDIALFLSEGANDDEWYELCMRRSVIQILLDEYAGTPLAALIDPSDVADLDLELRRVGIEQGPIPDPFVPDNLPNSHWWWHYPPTADDSGSV